MKSKQAATTLNKMATQVLTHLFTVKTYQDRFHLRPIRAQQITTKKLTSFTMTQWLVNMVLQLQALNKYLAKSTFLRLLLRMIAALSTKI